jgi:hypothetical protein
MAIYERPSTTEAKDKVIKHGNITLILNPNGTITIKPNS